MQDVNVLKKKIYKQEIEDINLSKSLLAPLSVIIMSALFTIYYFYNPFDVDFIIIDKIAAIIFGFSLIVSVLYLMMIFIQKSKFPRDLLD